MLVYDSVNWQIYGSNISSKKLCDKKSFLKYPKWPKITPLKYNPPFYHNRVLSQKKKTIFVKQNFKRAVDRILSTLQFTKGHYGIVKPFMKNINNEKTIVVFIFEKC